MDSRELGGDVSARVDELRSRVPQLGLKLAAAGYEQARNLPPPALEHRGGRRIRNRVTALQAEMARLEKNARALEQAGQQLKGRTGEMADRRRCLRGSRAAGPGRLPDG